ncbi:high-affinity Zn(2+) transporter zrt1 [Amphichorda felina]
MGGSDEYHVQTTPTQTTDIPAQFTGCHSHDGKFFCVGPDGEDVAAVKESTSNGEEEHDHDAEHGDEHGGEDEHDHGAEGEEVSGGKENCHFHAGVEHCVSTGEEEQEDSSAKCDATPREYNVKLRVGLLFVILTTSAIGVFGPILIHRWMPSKLNLVFVLLKQFGTGIIISTAFIHLYTHASLMFTNECIGTLDYEAVTSSIVMAGLFISFVVEYIGQRVVSAKLQREVSLTSKERAQTVLSSEVVNILVMELGILFHSLLIGLTLVVSGDSFFITLFVVILFHQVFEGIALGTRIATIGTPEHVVTIVNHTETNNGASPDADKNVPHGEEGSSTSSETLLPTSLSMKQKLILASLFAFITPIGMAIGIGVLDHFNGNDKNTIIAIGTLDALSAGILIWVGVVEMWAGDWMTGSHGHKAELADADWITVTLAGFGLVAGFVIMSLLGKWA